MQVENLDLHPFFRDQMDEAVFTALGALFPALSQADYGPAVTSRLHCSICLL
jgi:hypothetical protein